MAGSVRSYSSSFGQAGHQSFLQLNPLLGAPIRVIHRLKLVMTTLFDQMSFGGATPRLDRYVHLQQTEHKNYYQTGLGSFVHVEFGEHRQGHQNYDDVAHAG